MRALKQELLEFLEMIKIPKTKRYERLNKYILSLRVSTAFIKGGGWL